jgi:hypothetical protein
LHERQKPVILKSIGNKYKGSLFRALFNEKTAPLNLYNTLGGTLFTSEMQRTLYTLVIVIAKSKTCVLPSVLLAVIELPDQVTPPVDPEKTRALINTNIRDPNKIFFFIKPPNF